MKEAINEAGPPQCLMIMQALRVLVLCLLCLQWMCGDGARGVAVTRLRHTSSLHKHGQGSGALYISLSAMKPNSRWTKLTLSLLHPRLTGVQLNSNRIFSPDDYQGCRVGRGPTWCATVTR